MASRSPTSATLYDLDEILARGAKQFERYFSQECGVDPDLLLTTEGPCPKCGGNTRFRVIDSTKGALFCSHCFNRGNGDVFAATQWLLNCSFSDAVKRVASYFGVEPSKHASASGKRNKNLDPAKDLIFQPWREETTELYAYRFIDAKPPVTMAAIKFLGGRFAQYKKRYNVIAFPVWGENAVKNADNQAKPVGWILYNANGGTLPKWNPQEKKNEEVKVKLTNGSQPGIVGNLEAIRAAGEVWKLEGSTDLLAFHSLAGLPPGVAALTNANGCGENPQRPDKAFMLEPFRGKVARVCHDSDQPGQRGAIGFTNDKTGRFHDGWGQAIATVAKECRNVVMPYEISETHGKDFRDWAIDGGNWQGLVGLVESAKIIQPGSGSGNDDPDNEAVNEAPDDPHRLAKVNLDRYSRMRDGAKLGYWNDEWYKWIGEKWSKISKTELRAKVAASIKEDYDRLWRIENAQYKEWRESDKYEPEQDKGPPTCRKITQHLTTNVMHAMASLTLIKDSQTLNSWIANEHQERQRVRNCISLKNGILDIDALLRNEPDCVLKHSSSWFSLVSLPYSFDPTAECPKWKAFLEKNMEGDHRRIAILQEYVGYCLIQSTQFQKFLFMEGDGSNGKSVFMAAVQALLGEQNCSNVPLEVFGEQFMLVETIGKLVNIIPECSEMDLIAEGHLKSFTSGDRMQFNRKGLAPISAKPTARLIISANVRPRFADKTSGLWRRMILMPWRYKIKEADKIRGMDDVQWWEESGELAGIFIWAIQGLNRLLKNKRFTESPICEAALLDYQHETNPAKAFLAEYYSESESPVDFVKTQSIYDHYKEWALDSGLRPLSDKSFGKEVLKSFPMVKRERIMRRALNERFYAYRFMKYIGDEDREDDFEFTYQSKESEAF